MYATYDWLALGNVILLDHQSLLGYSYGITYYAIVHSRLIKPNIFWPILYFRMLLVISCNHSIADCYSPRTKHVGVPHTI